MAEGVIAAARMEDARPRLRRRRVDQHLVAFIAVLQRHARLDQSRDGFLDELFQIHPLLHPGDDPGTGRCHPVGAVGQNRPIRRVILAA